MRLRRAGRPDDPGRQGAAADPDFTAYATQAASRPRDTAYLMCRDWHLADDLTQTAPTKLYLAWPRVSKATFEDAAAPDSSDLRMTLVDALALLKPQDRAILVLRYWEDYSVEQVASLLEIGEGAVRTRSMRALAKLRIVLNEELSDLLG